MCMAPINIFTQNVNEKKMKILGFITHFSMSQNFKYDKCSKINMFLFFSQIKCLEFTKWFGRLVNMEDSDQKQNHDWQ